MHDKDGLISFRQSLFLIRNNDSSYSKIDNRTDKEL
jgi:hypothetical protein